MDVVKTIKNSEKLLVSLDLSSLFTNVPLLEAVQSPYNHIQEPQIEVYLSVNDLKWLLCWCTVTVQCLFYGEIYR